MRSALPFAALVLYTLTRAGAAAAQETPTERTAAADVIRRVNDLERSLALPQLVARLTGKDPRRDAVVARARELMERELLAMADDITRHPEVGHKEERSVKILTDYLKAHDFAVEMGVAGLATAFVARYKNGTPGPNLGVILEYDALRGPSRDFHGRSRPGAPAPGVGRARRADGRDRAVQPYRRPAQDAAAGNQDSGNHHGRRQGPERGPRPRRRRVLDSLPGPDLSRAGTRSGKRCGPGGGPRHRNQGAHRRRLVVPQRHLGRRAERRRVCLLAAARRHEGRAGTRAAPALRGDGNGGDADSRRRRHGPFVERRLPHVRDGSGRARRGRASGVA